MSKKVVTPTNQKEKVEKSSIVVPVRASRSSKVQAALAPRFGMNRNQVQRVLNEAENNFDAWRKEGFKGAWWKRYFKNEAGVEAGSN
jgi:hypothetical protein